MLRALISSLVSETRREVTKSKNRKKGEPTAWIEVVGGQLVVKYECACGLASIKVPNELQQHYPDGSPRHADGRSPEPPGRRSVEAIRQRAVGYGVAEQFDRFVRMSEEAGLAVQPQKLAVRIAPPTDRRHYLMYARPEPGNIVISAGAREFAEFFPSVTEEEANAGLGATPGGVFLSGADLDARLDQIEAFLQRTFPN